MKSLTELNKELTASAQPFIIITTHHKPDADAMGSSLGLYHYLKVKGFNNVQVIAPTDYGSSLHWMPANDLVMVYEEQEARSKELIAQANYIFCLDFNALKRINEMGHEVAISEATKVMIDHHLEPENFADFGISDTKACSTAELIHRYIHLSGDDALMNKDIAECLYAGILTDTGNFRHDTTTAQTHRIVADLIAAGANSSYIQSQIYDNFSLSRMQFIGHILANKLHILEGLNTALMVIDRNELRKYDIITGDTEGLVNYGLSISGVKLAILVIDRTVRVKMSFRGKGTFPCNEFARKYFKGGGHFNAAGGESEDPLEVVVANIKTYLQEYKHLLNP